MADDLVSRYNYDEFVPAKFQPWMRFAESPPLGQPTPDFPLWTLEEEETSLAAVWGANAFTVVEFGSFTSPYCGMAAPSLNRMADRFTPQGIGSIFLYTHEAHPGEHYPHHTSFAQKLRYARALRDVSGVTRPILVDALDGACHRAYGSMPNMTWIISKAGVPVYKAEWTDPESIENALEHFLQDSTGVAKGSA